MIKFAVRNPNENAKSITMKGFNTLGFTADNEKLVTLLPFRRCIGSLELTKAETLQNRGE